MKEKNVELNLNLVNLRYHNVFHYYFILVNKCVFINSIFFGKKKIFICYCKVYSIFDL